MFNIPHNRGWVKVPYLMSAEIGAIKCP